MTRAELEAKRIVLLAEGEDLLRAYERLRLTPSNSPDHAAHRAKTLAHHHRLRNYLNDLRNRQDTRDT
jgi:hypothetical protein